MPYSENPSPEKPQTPSSLKESLAPIFEHLLTRNDAEFQSIVDGNAFLRHAVALAAKGDLENFSTQIRYPFDRLFDFMLRQALPDHPQAQFLFSQVDFVRGHFRRVIERIDGPSCCADKTSAILGRLMRHFLTGEPVVFDPTEAFTYHHPKKVFTTHAQVIEFFEALRELYYGYPMRYIRALAAMQSADLDVEQPR